MATKKKTVKKAKVATKVFPNPEITEKNKLTEENKLLKEQLTQMQLQTSMSSTEIYRYQHLAAINNQTEVIRSGVNAIGSILSDLLDKDKDDEDIDEEYTSDDD